MKKALFLLVSVGVLLSCHEKKQSSTPQAFESDLQSLKEYFHIPGMAAMVTHNGQVVYENYFGHADLDKRIPVDSTTIFPMASVTKVFATVLIMKLVDSGELSLDDPINNFLHESGLSDSIKVKHVLSHTSEGSPGAFFNYSGRFSMLTNVLEKSGKASFEQLLRTQILQPLSLRNTYPLSDDSMNRQIAKPYYFFGQVEEGHYEVGLSTSSGLASNVRDLSRFANALYTNLLISNQHFNNLSKPFETTHGTSPYGLGIFTQEILGKRIIWAYGQEDCFSSLMVMVPEENVTLTLLANNNLMSDPPRLINGDVTYSLFALNFLKHFVFDVPVKFEWRDWQRPSELDIPRGDYDAFYRQEILANALTATFMSQLDSMELHRSSELMHLAFEHFPDYTEYGNLSLMRALNVLAEKKTNEFGKHLENLGKTLLDEYEHNPYANVYMAYYYQSRAMEDSALYHFKKIVDAPKFRPFWYTLEALHFLGQHYKKEDPELAREYFGRIVDIGWNMGGVLDKAKAELERL